MFDYRHRDTDILWGDHIIGGGRGKGRGWKGCEGKIYVGRRGKEKWGEASYWEGKVCERKGREEREGEGNDGVKEVEGRQSKVR